MERILTTTGNPCTLGCKYCFAAAPQYNSFPNLSEVKQVSLFAADYQHIQLACDTELFLNPQQALRLIEAVVEAGSNVSFISELPTLT